MLPALGGSRTIDVWSFVLDGALAAPEVLDGVERARLRRMRSPSKRLEFLVGRSMLRTVLGDVLDVSPAEVLIEYGAHGKPRLPGDELTFNLSHSGDRALVAVAAGGRVGVDVEQRRPRRPFRRLSRRFFAEAEDRWLHGLQAADRAAGFYRAWTLKESYLKAIGTGLAFSSRHFAMELACDPPRLMETGYPGDEPALWHFATPEVRGGYAAALCWDGPARRVRRRQASELSRHICA
ncbi:MAG TPA: 4'-phosphopantetheinyl transferase superfamily protein [Acidobacteriota bacterium]|nr:4'-phosphopantetheinyl transferase superfamily protein [Acidobacteriota bacterium]